MSKDFHCIMKSSYIYIHLFLDISKDPRETCNYLNLTFFFGTVHLCPVRNTWLYQVPIYIYIILKNKFELENNININVFFSYGLPPASRKIPTPHKSMQLTFGPGMFAHIDEGSLLIVDNHLLETIRDASGRRRLLPAMRDCPAGRRRSSGVHRRVDADESEPQKHLGVYHRSGKALDRRDPEDERWEVRHRLHPTDNGEDRPSPPGSSAFTGAGGRPVTGPVPPQAQTRP